MESSVDLVVQVNQVGRQQIDKVVQAYEETHACLLVERFDHDSFVFLIQMNIIVLCEVSLLHFFDYSL